jgi:phage host-nuclease inhibitor protein Gam
MTTTVTSSLPAHAEVPPARIDRANEALGHLRNIRAEVSRLQAELDATVAKLVANAQSDVSYLMAQVPELELQLREFAEAYRSQLAKGRGQTQTITLPNGKLVWSMSRLSIDVDDEMKALADISRHGWTKRFTVSKPAIVKDRLKESEGALKDARKIKGLTINDPEEVFSIKLGEIKLSTDTRLKSEPASDNTATEQPTPGRAD